MSTRSSVFGGGRPGGVIEYRGDLPAPDSTYASALPATPLASRLTVPATTNRTGSAVVDRRVRRGGHHFFYSHGAVPMPNALPGQGAAQIGGVNSSAFQPYNVALMDWQINTSWYESGYPRNLGLSTRVPQLQTNVTGAPGKSRQQPRPLFTRVQTVERARVVVRTYQTQGAKS